MSTSDGIAVLAGAAFTAFAFSAWQHSQAAGWFMFWLLAFCGLLVELHRRGKS